MIIKDRFGHVNEIYQARNGSFQLVFGNNSMLLTEDQVDKLCNPYDIEDFDLISYNRFYHIIAEATT